MRSTDDTTDTFAIGRSSRPIFYSCGHKCAPGWERSNDLLLKRELLYQLSYGRE